MIRLDLIPQPASAESFKPFGIYIEPGKAAPTFSSPSFDWYENVVTLDINTPEVGFVKVASVDCVQKQLERHVKTPEVMIATKSELYVTLADNDAQTPEDFAAFILSPGSITIINPGIWHLAPKSKTVDAGAIIMYKPETGTNDKEIIDLSDRGLDVTIKW